MSGFGSDLVFIAALGYVVLGPQRMHRLLQQIARVKQDFHRAQQDVTAQLSGALDAEPKHPDG